MKYIILLFFNVMLFANFNYNDVENNNSMIENHEFEILDKNLSKNKAFDINETQNFNPFKEPIKEYKEKTIIDMIQEDVEFNINNPKYIDKYYHKFEILKW